MKKHIKYLLITWLGLATALLPAVPAQAGILEVLKAALVKAIRAADLAIQRQQNRIVWLQNAQKVLENALSKFKLEEISEWTQKQKEQYADYFEELRKVKLLISYYQRIRDIMETQTALVEEYRRVWDIVRSDQYF